MVASASEAEQSASRARLGGFSPLGPASYLIKITARGDPSLRETKEQVLKVTDTAAIEEKVIKIVCDQLSSTPDKVTRDTSFINDLGADSLDTVELVMELEDEFGVSIPDEDAEKISTVGTAVDYICSKSD